MNERLNNIPQLNFVWNLKKTFLERKKMIDDGFAEGVLSHTTIYTSDTRLIFL